MNSNELRSQLEFHIGFEGFLCFLKEAETIFFEMNSVKSDLIVSVEAQ